MRDENRVLREQLARRRLRLTDDQRRRLAVKGKTVGCHRLGECAGLVMPDSILGLLVHGASMVLSVGAGPAAPRPLPARG